MPEGVRAEVERRADGRCEGRAVLAHVCGPGPSGVGWHLHHLRPRGRGGPDDAGNLVRVCGALHAWVHDHPAEAGALGLLR